MPKFTFNQVLDYVFFHRHGLHVLLNYNNNEELKKDEHDYTLIMEFEKNNIKIAGDHNYEHLYIEDGYIIYEEGSGA